MRIVNQPKIILTHEEADAFTNTIRLLESITESPENPDADLRDWFREAWAILANIWQDDSITVE